jgi:hypothetical protein
LSKASQLELRGRSDAWAQRKQTPAHLSEFLAKYLSAAFTEKSRLRNMVRADQRLHALATIWGRQENE